MYVFMTTNVAIKHFASENQAMLGIMKLWSLFNNIPKAAKCNRINGDVVGYQNTKLRLLMV
jgi:hypothetical protein